MSGGDVSLSGFYLQQRPGFITVSSPHCWTQMWWITVARSETTWGLWCHSTSCITQTASDYQLLTLDPVAGCHRVDGSLFSNLQHLALLFAFTVVHSCWPTVRFAVHCLLFKWLIKFPGLSVSHYFSSKCCNFSTFPLLIFYMIFNLCSINNFWLGFDEIKHLTGVTFQIYPLDFTHMTKLSWVCKHFPHLTRVLNILS